MSDHVLDDEVCWCGVPLECHDDVYDEIRGWHHRPDPIPPPLVTDVRSAALAFDQPSTASGPATTSVSR